SGSNARDLPGRVAVYSPDAGAPAPAANGHDDALLAKVRSAQPGTARLLADWLRGVRCRDGVAAAMRSRRELGVGEVFVTPRVHLIAAQSFSFFAPDSDLHGVLARQRELAELARGIAEASAAASAARDALAGVEALLEESQANYHAERLAFSSQQRRCHELELELLQLKQAAEAAAQRRAQ